MKVTRAYAIELNQVLTNADVEFEKPITGRFRYMVSANAKLTEDERKLTLEAYPYDPKFIEYINKDQELRREIGVDTEAKRNAMSPEELDAAEQRLVKLHDEYIDAINAEEQLNKAREEFLNEEIELDLKTVRPDDVPNIIAQNDWQIWNVLAPIVKE